MFRKSVFAAAVAAFAFAGAAGAADSTWVANTASGGAADTDTFNQTFNPNPAGNVTFAGTEADLGSIVLGSAAKYKVSFTFLGREAGFTNHITVNMGGDSMSNRDAVGETLTSTATGGSLLDFTFLDQKGRTTSNGDVFGVSPMISWGWLDGATSSLSNSFDYIIGLNDSAGGASRDYDDMVVGITITAVPEPESLALMLAGLGCVAVVGRRRKQA